MGNPVRSAQAVENGATHTMARVRLERNAARGIETGDCLDQPYDSHADQVVQLHRLWQTRVNRTCDLHHQRMMAKNLRVSVY